jgi:peptidoglycan LD-endopeptidase LytH
VYMEATLFTAMLQKHARIFHPVVPFDPATDKLYPLNFTETNKELDSGQIADTERFAAYVSKLLREHGCKYGIGGYGEHRTLYARSKHFDNLARALPGAGGEGGPRIERTSKDGDSRIGGSAKDAGGSMTKGAAGDEGSAGLEDAKDAVVPGTEEEPRRLHLGIDIWGAAGTKVMAPLDGVVHSFAFNNNDSDYGATLVLTHNLAGNGFHTLYGHLSLNSLKNLHEGKNILRGEVIGEFGMRFENGNWPPHLHFQLIRDMQGWKGDYPGVCKYSQRRQWLENCPDPDLLLQMNRYI